MSYFEYTDCGNCECNKHSEAYRTLNEDGTTTIEYECDKCACAYSELYQIGATLPPEGED